MDSSKRILIIGGAGFIGSNVAEFYAKKGNLVILFDNLQRNKTEKNVDWLKKTFPGMITFVLGNICKDREKLKGLMELVDVVFHLAGQVAVVTSVKEPLDDCHNNLLGTVHVLEAIRASKRRPILMFSSTNKVYGELEDVSVKELPTRYEYDGLPQGVSEKQQLNFHSPYGCSKGAADQYVRDYARIYGLKTVVFRQSCIYGYRQFGAEEQGWIAWFIIATILNKPITVFGDGKQMRDILFIDDLCEAYDAAIRNIENTSGNIYNIGGGQKNTLSILELLKILGNIFQKEIPTQFADWRPGDQKVFVCDITKADRVFGWKPQTTPEEGIRKLVSWVEKNKDIF